MFYALYVSSHRSPLKSPITDVATSQPKQENDAEKKDLDSKDDFVDPATVRLLSETNNASADKGEKKDSEKVSVI